MMTNLFSIFDPSMSVLSISWLMCIFSLLVLPMNIWTTSSTNTTISFLLEMLMKETKYVIDKPSKGVYLFISSIFITLSLLNSLAIFPHLFSATSHMLVTLPFSYIFWMSVVGFIWASAFNHFLSHLIPMGTPIFLISFMVMVELLSNFIRPLALTFRLTANMMAGHLLMSLIGGAMIKLPVLMMMMFIPIQSMLVFMELGVSIIQAYVFSTLILLYISEGL